MVTINETEWQRIKSKLDLLDSLTEIEPLVSAKILALAAEAAYEAETIEVRRLGTATIRDRLRLADKRDRVRRIGQSYSKISNLLASIRFANLLTKEV